MAIIQKRVGKLTESGVLIFPSHPIDYEVPEGFHESDRELFYEENFRDEIPAVNMFKLDKIAIINGSLIQSGLFLHDFTHHNNIKSVSRIKAFIRLKVMPNEYMDEAICGVMDWSDNYFHWMTELLPRLLAMFTSLGNVPVLLTEKTFRLPFVQASLEQLKIKSRLLPSGKALMVGKLHASKVPHVGRFNQYLLGDFRSKVFQELGYNNTVIPFRKLYITRKSARRRKITNEQNILDEIKNWDFEQVTLEDLAWAEQIKLFSESKVVVSNHGAGLSNIMFMKAGTIVIELKAFNNDYWCYFSLARIHNLRYSYILCNSSDIDHRNADISVDMNILSQKLKNSEVLSV